MAIDLSKLVGGSKPPILLDDKIQVFIGGQSPQNEIEKQTGAQISAIVTSAALTEVLNIQGSGVMQLACVYPAAAAAVADAKFRIVIDGVQALDSTVTHSDQDSIRCAIGVWGGVVANNSFSLGEVVFKKSIVVSISGDGTDGMRFAHKRYLT